MTQRGQPLRNNYSMRRNSQRATAGGATSGDGGNGTSQRPGGNQDEGDRTTAHARVERKARRRRSFLMELIRIICSYQEFDDIERRFNINSSRCLDYILLRYLAALVSGFRNVLISHNSEYRLHLQERMRYLNEVLQSITG